MKRLIAAEWRVLIRRSSARGMLAISAIIPVLVTVVLGWAANSEIVWNGQPIAETFNFSGPHAGSLSLRARHAIFLPMFILFVTGSSLASERTSHLLRERLVQPVSRDSMLFAKCASLALLCTISLCINGVFSLSLGVVLMGGDGPWSSVLAGHALSLCTDVGLIALGVLLSTMFRSGAMVVVSGLLIYLTDQGIGVALFLLGVAGIESASVWPMLLPSTGWNLWANMMGEPLWSAGLNWLCWTGFLLGVARFRLLRMDVP